MAEQKTEIWEVYGNFWKTFEAIQNVSKIELCESIMNSKELFNFIKTSLILNLKGNPASYSGIYREIQTTAKLAFAEFNIPLFLFPTIFQYLPKSEIFKFRSTCQSIRKWTQKSQQFKDLFSTNLVAPTITNFQREPRGLLKYSYQLSMARSEKKSMVLTLKNGSQEYGKDRIGVILPNILEDLKPAFFRLQYLDLTVCERRGKFEDGFNFRIPFLTSLRINDRDAFLLEHLDTPRIKNVFIKFPANGQFHAINYLEKHCNTITNLDIHFVTKVASNINIGPCFPELKRLSIVVERPATNSTDDFLFVPSECKNLENLTITSNCSISNHSLTKSVPHFLRRISCTLKYLNFIGPNLNVDDIYFPQLIHLDTSQNHHEEIYEKLNYALCRGEIATASLLKSSSLSRFNSVDFLSCASSAGFERIKSTVKHFKGNDFDCCLQTPIGLSDFNMLLRPFGDFQNTIKSTLPAELEPLAYIGEMSDSTPLLVGFLTMDSEIDLRPLPNKYDALVLRKPTAKAIGPIRIKSGSFSNLFAIVLLAEYRNSLEILRYLFEHHLDDVKEIEVIRVRDLTADIVEYILRHENKLPKLTIISGRCRLANPKSKLLEWGFEEKSVSPTSCLHLILPSRMNTRLSAKYSILVSLITDTSPTLFPDIRLNFEVDFLFKNFVTGKDFSFEFPKSFFDDKKSVNYRRDKPTFLRVSSRDVNPEDARRTAISILPLGTHSQNLGPLRGVRGTNLRPPVGV
eukprot:GHVP01026510.1.p1 GENE.GHVP01026510.1~~GHVP01026510.1.p1  ORF type:complete len:743 (-),score=91.38 GHVP01026510.1:53-2281(-)